MTPVVNICTGGDREWFAIRRYCFRCWGTWTHFGYVQAWYDPEVVCSHCGARNGRKDGRARDHVERRRWFREQFVAWLLAGSPRLDLTPYMEDA